MGKPQQQQSQSLPQRREQQQQQQQRKPKPASVVGEEEEEEEEEGGSENDQDDDNFFESMDRVPSGVSYDFDDVPSSSTDEDYDDMRFSFASAIAPPLDPRRDDDSSDDDEDDGFDYGIWMAEPISVDERRRRLLQGFTSSKDMVPSAKPGGRPPPPPAGGGVNREILASRRRSLKISKSRLSRFSGAPPLPPSPSLTRSRSEILLRVPAGHTPFRRASSAPPSLCGQAGHRAGHRSTEPEARAVAGGGEAADNDNRARPESGSPADENVCKIKNLDDGKEFVVSKDGSWGKLNDLQTGLQLTLEEFERFLGYSPIVKELMRRVNLSGSSSGNGSGNSGDGSNKKRDSSTPSRSSKSSSSRRKGGSWLKNIKFVASSMTGLILEKDREHGLGSVRRSSSSPAAQGGNEWMKVRHHGKSYKELTGLYMCQQIQAHQGSIWCIKFSPDSLYLASAGEDCVVLVWQVTGSDTASSSLLPQNSRSSLPPLHPANGSSDQSARMGTPPSKRTKKASRRSSVPDYIITPETIFSLSEKPVCSFEGHLDDVLDLSWSKSQYLLSSSMDKTVRLWDMESKACLKLFAHNDFVTCIQFNPVDDRYFISGSLDAKVRIWSIPDRQVVDWTDLHEMVTAVCYTPDGQGALVGSHKGSCRFYNTSGCKLNQESQIDVCSKKRKSHAKKITGFQFAPGNPSEVLITSADSRIRVFDGVDLIHKFRGFRNTSSQISASFTLDGKFVVCASEDSHVYLWRRNAARHISGGGRNKGLVNTRSHEHFYCKDVSVAIPWPTAGSNCPPPSLPPLSGRLNNQHWDYPDSQYTSNLEDNFPSGRSDCPPLPKGSSPERMSPSLQEELRYPSRSGSGSGLGNSDCSPSTSQRSDGISSASVSASSSSSSSSWGWYRGGSNRSSALEVANAWGLVVVTAGLGGDIKIYQNFGLPLRLSRQTNLF